MLFDCFETRSPSKRDVIQQHLVALGISVLVNWIIWLAMGIGYYSCLESGLLARAIAVDLVEVAIETAVVIELAIMLCKAVSRIYSRRQPRFRIILEQVLISYALISIVCVCIGLMYKELEPEYPDVFWRTFISDSLVVSMFVLVFFTSSLTNKYRDRQEEVLRLKLDVLSIQSDYLHRKPLLNIFRGGFLILYPKSYPKNLFCRRQNLQVDMYAYTFLFLLRYRQHG